MLPTAAADILRWALIASSTGYAIWRVWQWHWLAGLVAALPIFLVMLNVWGLATLPLYGLTREARRLRQQERDLLRTPR